MVLCPLCGRDARKHFQLAHTVVWNCRASDCGLQFADPQLDETDLARAYAEHYYPSSGTAGSAAYENTPEEILRQVLIESQAKFGSLAGKRLLDFGCGVGRLCQIAQEHGIHTTGIEADPNARQLASINTGMRVYGSIDELEEAEPNAKFDIITMWDVVEHLREPWSDMERLSGLLQPGGWFLLSTMNSGSLRALFEREKWSNIVNPTHFYYFTRASLRTVFERSGFSAIDEWRFTIRYPSHSFIRRLFNRGLWALGMQGQLLFIARLSR